MALEDDLLYEWAPEKMVEVQLFEPQDFLKIKETLERIGVGNREKKTLVQTCHIFHKAGRYYICHFKELIGFDGRKIDLTLGDVARRNKIVSLLQNWKLLKLPQGSDIGKQSDMSDIKVVPFKEKNEWTYTQKYTIGKKKKSDRTV